VTLPYRLRADARHDVRDALDYYLAEEADEAAYGLVVALDDACATIAEHPGIGSRRHGESLGLDRLQTWPVTGFPFLVCYLEQGDHIDVWRVLHMRRDIASAFDDGI